MKVTKEQMRAFSVNYHGFTEFYELDAELAVERIFERLQSVQFDPLNVVGRNAELVLFSRNKNLTRQTLYDSLYSTRTLVDGWDKMMCIYPSAQFPLFRHVRENMKKYYEGVLSWRRQTDDCFANLDGVYEYIKKNGPVLVTDIPSAKTSDGGWGPTKIAGVCCEYLYFCGKIAVAYKKGVVKAFDITERLIANSEAPSGFADEHEFLLWYVKRRIAAVGVACNKKGGAWLGPFVEDNALRTDIMNELADRGEVLPITVEGSKTLYYICKEAQRFFDMPSPPPSRAVFVAPLDNMIWDRKAAKDIFGFDYSWEVYVPAAKRKYGYYVLPIMIGDRFVGRFEPVQYKTGEALDIKHIWFEPDYSPRDGDADMIAAEMTRLAAFLGVDVSKSIKDKILLDM